MQLTLEKTSDLEESVEEQESKDVEGISYTLGNGQVKIWQKDVIQFLKEQPDNSIDLIVTDPAYSGMNQMLKLGRGKIIGTYKDKGQEGAKWFDEFHDTEENYRAFLRECYRVLKEDRHIYIMFDSYSLLSLGNIVRSIFDVKNLICWDKVNIGLGHYYRRRHEFILFASKGKRKLTSKSIPDVWQIKRITRASYPTQKPTEVFELMIKASTEEGFVVCDPFLGSGSSAIASLKEGCHFIGCDISEKSLETTKHRVEHFLKDNVDPLQKKSKLVDTHLIDKVFMNGEPK